MNRFIICLLAASIWIAVAVATPLAGRWTPPDDLDAANALRFSRHEEVDEWALVMAHDEEDGDGATNQSTTMTPPLSNASKEQIRNWQGQMMSNYMDWSVDPCTDFYRFACGNWDHYNPIPDDAAGFDTFEKLRDQLHETLQQLLESTDNSSDSLAVTKAKDLYRSCMDLDKLEERGKAPLLQLLQDLGGWPILSTSTEEWSSDGTNWVDLMARLRLYNNDIFISMWVGPDGRNSDSHVIQLDQGDLVLPSKEYYLEHDRNSTAVMEAYTELMRATAMTLGGQADVVDHDVTELIQFETQLAKILIPNEERRNITSMYHKLRVFELEHVTPLIPWERYLSIVLDRNIEDDVELVVYASDYFPQLGALLNKTDSRTLHNYLLWRFVWHRMNNLDRQYQQLKQRFYSVLYGQKKQPKRWRYCISYVNNNMGMAIGSLFVKNFFGHESKNDTIRLIVLIQDTFSRMLDEADWLDEGTKISAKDKLYNMNLKVGYPDYIIDDEALDKDYDQIEIDRESYFENVLRILRHVVQDELKRLNETVDRQEWTTTPAVVNAYYSRTRNQIMLPAGILQPPFYHSFFPKALNYGGIGVVIGHEITHGFDDQGRQYDSKGNFQPLWPEEIINNFETRTQCIIEQYSNYSNDIAGTQVRINGINTQGENIADNGGIRQAFKVYESWLRSTPGALEDENLPGLNVTDTQLFFLNFAQIWCGALRPEAAISKTRTAVHAPGRFRVIGSLSNMKEFSEVFQCSEDSAMNPNRRCVVW